MSSAIRSTALYSHQIVQGVVADALASHGFAPDRARGAWVRRVPGGIEHTVSVPADIASNSGPVAVTVNLGVHYRPLAERLARGSRAGHHLATFTRNVGQLMQRRAWREWTVAGERDAPRIAERLARAVTSVGLPWLDDHRTADDFCRGLRTYGHHDHQFLAMPLLQKLLEERHSHEPEAFGDGADAAEPVILSVSGGCDAVTWRCDE